MPAFASSCVGIFNFIIRSMIVDGGSCFEEPFGFFYCKFSTKKYQEPFLLWKSVKPSVNDCEISEFGWGADP